MATRHANVERSAVQERDGRSPSVDARARMLAGLPVTSGGSARRRGDRGPRGRLGPAAGPAPRSRRETPRTGCGCSSDLVATHRVIAPDLPGHGASELDDGPLGADRVLAWLGELIDATCAAPPVLVGNRSAARSRPASRPSTRIASAGWCSWTRSASPVRPGAGVRRRPHDFLAQPSEARTTSCGASARTTSTACARRWARTGTSFEAYNLDRARTASVLAALDSLME